MPERASQNKNATRFDPSFSSHAALEEKLQRELDQSRVGSRRSARDHSEILVVRGATRGVGGSELRSVEQVEKFRPELQSEIPVAAKHSLLKQCEIKIVNPLRAQPRFDARLIAEGEISRSRETGGIKPALGAW